MGLFRILLAVINRHKVWGWIGLLVYASLAIFPHQTVQYYANEIAIHYTHKRLYQGSAIGAVILGVIFALMLLWGLRRQPERLTIGIAGLVTMLLMIGTWRVFMANNTELIHFPQYLPEGMILLALTLSPVESIAWATLFGGLDEAFQYTFLVEGRPVPYDFNDIFMDLLGGAAGVVLAMTLLRTERRKAVAGWWRDVLRRPGILVILAAIAAGTVMWAAGVMTLYEAPGAPPHWFSLSRQHNLPFWFSVEFLGPRTFHELSPLEGPMLLVIALALYALLDRRLRISAPPRKQ